MGNNEQQPVSRRHFLKAGVMAASAAAVNTWAVKTGGDNTTTPPKPAGIPEGALYLDVNEKGEHLWVSLQPPGDNPHTWLCVWEVHDAEHVTMHKTSFSQMEPPTPPKDSQAGKRAFQLTNSYNPEQKRFIYFDSKPPLNETTLTAFRDGLRDFHKEGVKYDHLLAGFQNSTGYYPPDVPKYETSILVDTGKYGEHIWLVDHTPMGRQRVHFGVHVCKGEHRPAETFVLSERGGVPRTDPFIFKDHAQPHRKVEIPVSDFENRETYERNLKPVAEKLRELHSKGAQYEDIFPTLYQGIDHTLALPDRPRGVGK